MLRATPATIVPIIGRTTTTGATATWTPYGLAPALIISMVFVTARPTMRRRRFLVVIRGVDRQHRLLEQQRGHGTAGMCGPAIATIRSRILLGRPATRRRAALGRPAATSATRGRCALVLGVVGGPGRCIRLTCGGVIGHVRRIIRFGGVSRTSGALPAPDRAAGAAVRPAPAPRRTRCVRCRGIRFLRAVRRVVGVGLAIGLVETGFLEDGWAVLDVQLHGGTRGARAAHHPAPAALMAGRGLRRFVAVHIRRGS